MQDQFLMRSVCYDSVSISGRNELPLFIEEDDLPGERVTAVLEAEIVRWFFNLREDLVKYLFYDELDIELTYIPAFEVSRPLILDNDKPGDIDILLTNKNYPNRAIAFQVKRVRAKIDEKDTAVLQISQIEKGLLQTKKMYQKYRFHQNYLLLIAVVDAHKRSQHQMFRHLSFDEKKAIYYHYGFGDLPEDVGIFILEVDQLSQNGINGTARLSTKLLKAAKPIDQLNQTTEGIMQYLRNH